MNQKRIALLLSVLLLTVCIAGCGNQDAADDHSPNNGTDALPEQDQTHDRNDTDEDHSDLSGQPEEGNPVFPNTLAEADAEVALDDLIATLGLSATDLDTAMREVSTVGDSVEGARTYRHKLLGRQAEVSYAFDGNDRIDHITIRTEKDLLEDWRTHLKSVLGADAVEGEIDAWDYSDSRVRLLEQDGKLTITIQKARG